jgi:hypothetical protein
MKICTEKFLYYNFLHPLLYSCHVHTVAELLALVCSYSTVARPRPVLAALPSYCTVLLVHQPTGLPDTFYQNHIPCDLPDLHFLILFTFTLAQNVLLRCFSAGCFAQPQHITISHGTFKGMSLPIPVPCFCLQQLPPQHWYH